MLRGARQVGKTTLVDRFSMSYDHYIYLNLELSQDRKHFEQKDNVQDILNAILIEHNISLAKNKTLLLFIDEIQESHQAIRLLRYFYEKLPDIHVIAAGSLLEFALSEVEPFPVGRIEYAYLYPLNFDEFLNAIGQQLVLESLRELPVKEYIHSTLLDLFNNYVIVGGMPEVVRRYAEDRNIANLPPVYEGIWETYKSDVVKYTDNKTEQRVIRHVIAIAHLYVDQRITFQNFGNSNYRSREVGEAMRHLDAAQIIQLIYPTTDLAAPIIPNIKKSPRLQFLDTGLVNHSLGIQGKMIQVKDLSPSYRGSIIPHMITQEVISLNTHQKTKPNFWVRDKNQSSAEVDLVMRHHDLMIPIEIKSGKYGKLRSLHQYIERCDHHYAVRIYGGPFRIESAKTPGGKKHLLMNLPYYLGTQLARYIDYFTSLH